MSDHNNQAGHTKNELAQSVMHSVQDTHESTMDISNTVNNNVATNDQGATTPEPPAVFSPISPFKDDQASNSRTTDSHQPETVAHVSQSATVVKTEEHDSTNVDESNHKHDHVSIPEEDGEAAVVAEIKHEVDENDNTSNAADTEAAAAMADAEDEDVKMEEEIKEEDEGDGDVAANRHQTSEWGNMLFAHAAAVAGRDPSDPSPSTPGAFGAFAEKEAEGPTAE